MAEEMQTLKVKKSDFKKILTTAETLLEEVEQALSVDEVVKKRINDIESEKVEGKTEQELDEYLKKRGVQID